MISVPSRLQLLNGNKLWMIALVWVITSCGTRNIQKTEVVPINPKKPNTTRVQEDSVTRKPEIFDIDGKNIPVLYKRSKILNHNFRKRRCELTSICMLILWMSK